MSTVNNTTNLLAEKNFRVYELSILREYTENKSLFVFYRV